MLFYSTDSTTTIYRHTATVIIDNKILHPSLRWRDTEAWITSNNNLLNNSNSRDGWWQQRNSERCRNNNNINNSKTSIRPRLSEVALATCLRRRRSSRTTSSPWTWTSRADFRSTISCRESSRTWTWTEMTSQRRRRIRRNFQPTSPIVSQPRTSCPRRKWRHPSSKVTTRWWLSWPTEADIWRSSTSYGRARMLRQVRSITFSKISTINYVFTFMLPKLCPLLLELCLLPPQFELPTVKLSRSMWACWFFALTFRSWPLNPFEYKNLECFLCSNSSIIAYLFSCRPFCIVERPSDRCRPFVGDNSSAFDLEFRPLRIASASHWRTHAKQIRIVSLWKHCQACRKLCHTFFGRLENNVASQILPKHSLAKLKAKFYN